MKKPMTKEEIEEHARKYLEEKEKRQEEHELKQREKQRISSHMTAKFHTRAYEEVAYHEQILKEEREERENSRKTNLEKKQVYGKYVRQSFLPEISSKKEQERLEAIEALKHPVREQVKITPGTKVEIPIPERVKQHYYEEKDREANSEHPKAKHSHQRAEDAQSQGANTRRMNHHSVMSSSPTKRTQRAGLKSRGADVMTA
jgi:hypothetical protein